MKAYKYPLAPLLRTFDLSNVHLITENMQCPCPECSVFAIGFNFNLQEYQIAADLLHALVLACITVTCATRLTSSCCLSLPMGISPVAYKPT